MTVSSDDAGRTWAWSGIGLGTARPGNAGRNILYNNRLLQLDMSLYKTFKFTESKRLEFRAMAYNLTNTPSFNTPGTNENLATGGQVINLYSDIVQTMCLYHAGC